VSHRNEVATVKMEGLIFERGRETIGDFFRRKEGCSGVADERMREGKFVEYKRDVAGIAPKGMRVEYAK
jgi:hypothetical protein